MADDASDNRTDDRNWDDEELNQSEVPPGGWAVEDAETETDRIPIDLSGDHAGEEPTAEAANETEDENGYAPEPSSAPITPGEPTLEHAVFVLLGAVAMVLVLVRVVGLLG